MVGLRDSAISGRRLSPHSDLPAGTRRPSSASAWRSAASPALIEFQNQIPVDHHTDRKGWPDRQGRLDAQTTAGELLAGLVNTPAPLRSAWIRLFWSLPVPAFAPTLSGGDIRAALNSEPRWLSSSSSSSELRAASALGWRSSAIERPFGRISRVQACKSAPHWDRPPIGLNALTSQQDFRSRWDHDRRRSGPRPFVNSSGLFKGCPGFGRRALQC